MNNSLFDTFVVISRVHYMKFEHMYDAILNEYRLRFSYGYQHCEIRFPAEIVHGWLSKTRNELISDVIKPMIDGVKKELSKL